MVGRTTAAPCIMSRWPQRRRNVNLSMHDYITFRVRGDGHTYIASVRTDQLTGGDEEAWQAPLPTRWVGVNHRDENVNWLEVHAESTSGPLAQ